MTARKPEPELKRGRGRPPIGAPVPIRLPADLRARVADAGFPGEPLADTVRRLLDVATSGLMHAAFMEAIAYREMIWPAIRKCPMGCARTYPPYSGQTFRSPWHTLLGVPVRWQLCPEHAAVMEAVPRYWAADGAANQGRQRTRRWRLPDLTEPAPCPAPESPADDATALDLADSVQMSVTPKARP